MDDTTSMPDVAKFFMEFCMDESCGKCVPCRVGTVQLYRILERITQGIATQADLEIMEELCTLMKETSLCGLGQSAPNPLLSTLKFFREEYEALIKDPPVLVNGKRVPLIGRVSMDMICVDLRDCPEAKIGDLVVLWGAALPVEQIASQAGTIGYELLCQVTARVPLDYQHDAA